MIRPIILWPTVMLSGTSGPVSRVLPSHSPLRMVCISQISNPSSLEWAQSCSVWRSWENWCQWWFGTVDQGPDYTGRRVMRQLVDYSQQTPKEVHFTDKFTVVLLSLVSTFDQLGLDRLKTCVFVWVEETLCSSEFASLFGLAHSCDVLLERVTKDIYLVV